MIFVTGFTRLICGFCTEYRSFHPFFHNCRQIFVTRDCAETVQAIRTDFVPKHVEFDTKTVGRFLIHDQDSEMSSLFVTENYGISFTKVGDFVHLFFLHYSEVSTTGSKSPVSASFAVTQSWGLHAKVFCAKALLKWQRGLKAG